MMRSLRVTSLIICGYLSWTSAAGADVVTDWNLIASDAIFTAGTARPGPSGILDFATVHAAMHDAYQAFEKRFESYAAPIPNASGSPIAAVAAAAHDVLVAGFPSQMAAFDMTLTKYLDSKGLSLANAGVLVGREAAARVLNLRMGDGSFPSSPEVFQGGTRPGELAADVRSRSRTRPNSAPHRLHRI